MAPFLRGLMVQKKDIRPTVQKLWNDSRFNRGGIVAFTLLRYFIATTFITMTLFKTFNWNSWIIILIAISLVIILLLSRHTLRGFSHIEQQFTYERQPENSLPEALSFGSDMVLGQHYKFKTLHFISADNFQLPAGECFEWYVDKLNEILRQSSATPEKSEDDSDDKTNGDNQDESEDENNDGGNSNEGDGNDGDGNSNNGENDNSDGGSGEGNQNGEGADNGDNEASVGDVSQNEFGNGLEESKNQNGFTQQQLDSARDHSALWEEDELKQQEINEIITSTTNWGSIPGDMVEQIKASLIVRLDYRKVLSSFHTSILSSHRHLTRMRPNRRSGFDQMGSIYELASKLLVAVDVSGSVTICSSTRKQNRPLS